MKTTFKVTWISLLSTIVTLLTHILADTKYHPSFILKTPIVDIPYLFLIVMLLVYFLLTLLFIGINQMIPTTKLKKGIVFTTLVSIIWIILSMYPSKITSFSSFLGSILIILVPMSVYGIFLGYLSSEKKVEFSKRMPYFSLVSIMVFWLLFRYLYYFMDGDEPKIKDVKTIVWFLSSGLFIGLVFSMFKMYINSPALIKLTWLFNLSATIFIGYYLFSYSLDTVFYSIQYVKISFDVLGVMMGVLLTIIVDKYKKKMVYPS
ncbi:MAG: hypothetical protein WC939_03160 [Acholeplasmataceae bacterium]